MDADMNRDTAFFSYESALRAAIGFPAQELDGDGAAADELARTSVKTDAQRDQTAQDRIQVDRAVFAGSATASESATAESPEAKRSTSVTIRLSAAECAQLKQRAAEARLTLSAYVRSCTFEAEALRAQVKQALKELRGDARGDLRGAPRVDTSGKKPPASAMPSLAVHNPLPTDDPLSAGDPRRSWWQLRPSPKNLSAQA
jgi:predicted DNA binding CopG/RHH family protein